MKYKCVIFDCDGVLVDSEIITCKVLVSMAGELGLDINLDFTVKNFMGKSLKHIMEYLDTQLDVPLPPNFERDYRARTFTKFEEELQPIEGVQDLIAQLDVPFCVASSGPLNKIKTNLTITQLADKFTNRMFSCYEINSWKPEPDIFLHAAKTMGFKTSECVVVEDSSVGVQAALAGGFDVFRYSHNSSDDFANHTKVTPFTHMNQLLPLWSNEN
ncbi:HAD-IA family hydrolase [Flagellimonas algicola]|uniref:HAD family hydrolase n=1 Tax=Flagellimonas algicola TaxID=2583815 RepID=A0ABY2WRT9_9FLAO|nr:HAD-IA family hydrolase [Allomuricauda algicola]TMU57372.1 HAD family hydrolase [Allomuricauda algicola]